MNALAQNLLGALSGKTVCKSVFTFSNVSYSHLNNGLLGNFLVLYLQGLSFVVRFLFN